MEENKIMKDTVKVVEGESVTVNKGDRLSLIIPNLDGDNLIPFVELKPIVMKPEEEKARELVERFMVYAYDSHKGYKDIKVRTECSKQCALICVEEIIITVPQIDNEIFGVSKGLDYWNQVKQAIKEFKSK